MRTMKNIILLLLLLLIAVLVAAYFKLLDDDSTAAPPFDAVSADKPFTAAQTPAASSQSGSPAADGYQTTREPAAVTTGKPLEPGIRDAVRELVNTSQEGLVEEQTANGVQMNLKGRFRTAPVATVDENGEVTVRDYTSPPVE